MDAHGEDGVAPDLSDRLARIEGQVRGVSKMIQERRSCDQVLMQVMAARRARQGGGGSGHGEPGRVPGAATGAGPRGAWS